MSMTPEQSLMLAVSERAQGLRTKYVSARDPRGRELYAMAAAWFASSEKTWCLSHHAIAKGIRRKRYTDPDGHFESALEVLPPKQARAIRMRFAFPHGVGDVRPFTYREIGERMGTRTEQARIHVQRALLALMFRPEPKR